MSCADVAVEHIARAASNNKYVATIDRIVAPRLGSVSVLILAALTIAGLRPVLPDHDSHSGSKI